MCHCEHIYCNNKPNGKCVGNDLKTSVAQCHTKVQNWNPFDNPAQNRRTNPGDEIQIHINLKNGSRDTS
jgi:hypothetical protein